MAASELFHAWLTIDGVTGKVESAGMPWQEFFDKTRHIVP
jgi:hypothetical protein